LVVTWVFEDATTGRWILEGIASLALLLGAADGARRGGVRANIGMVVLLLSLNAGLRGYGVAGTWIGERFGLRDQVAESVGLVVCVLVSQIVFGAIGAGVGRWLAPPKLICRGWWVADRLLGVLPGCMSAAIVTWVLLTPLCAVDWPPGISEAAVNAAVPKLFSDRATQLVPGMADLVGRALVARAPRTEFLIDPDEGIRIEPSDVQEVNERGETELLALMNLERKRAGVPPLTVDPRLVEVARAHSREMLALGYFEHVSPVAGAPEMRLKTAGIYANRSGENIAYAPSVTDAHAGLMSSDSHRRNILDPLFTRVGIGTITGRAGQMVTQQFWG